MHTNIPLLKKALLGCCLCIVLGGMILACGCSQPPAVAPATTVPTTATPAMAMPTPTEAVTIPQKEIATYNESANGSTINVTAGKEFMIDLKENPTTGFRWIATMTSGLKVLNGTYTPDAAAAGMVGVGGTRSWKLTGTEEGMQQFKAVYLRPGVNVTGSEESYVLMVKVAKA
jgi:inhibitor of cysteine peptidase